MFRAFIVLSEMDVSETRVRHITSPLSIYFHIELTLECGTKRTIWLVMADHQHVPSERVFFSPSSATSLPLLVTSTRNFDRRTTWKFSWNKCLILDRERLCRQSWNDGWKNNEHNFYSQNISLRYEWHPQIHCIALQPETKELRPNAKWCKPTC